MNLNRKPDFKPSMFFENNFWNLYRKDFDNWYPNIIIEIRTWLRKETGIELSSEFLEIYFMVVLNRFFINSKYCDKQINNSLFSLQVLMDGSYKQLFFGEKIISLPKVENKKYFKFFHRHEYLFEKDTLSENSSEFSSSKIVVNYYFKFARFWQCLTGFKPTPILMNYINTLVINYGWLNNLDVSSNIYTNAHFIQNSPSKLLYLLVSKFKGAKIIVLQPSLFHPICSYYDQHELEISLATEYYAWQEGIVKPSKNNPNLKIRVVGSLYCCGSREIFPGPCVVMPQLPTSTYLRAQSKSFGLGKKVFFESNQLETLLKKIYVLSQSTQNPLPIRVKSVDKKRYEKIFEKERLFVKIIDGDINKGGLLEIYENMYIGYMGTALAEGFFSNANIVPFFEKGSEVALKRKYQKFFEPNNFKDDFYTLTVKPADIKFFKSQLREIHS